MKSPATPTMRSTAHLPVCGAPRLGEGVSPGGMAQGMAEEKREPRELCMNITCAFRSRFSLDWRRCGRNDDSMLARERFRAAGQIDKHGAGTEARLDPARSNAADGGLIDTRPLRQVALAEAFGLEDMDHLGPEIRMMHHCIMPDDASTHQSAFQVSENARMHEKTREIIKKLMLENSITSERQLALDCGMNQSTLNRFMKGTTDSLEFMHIQTIAHYFGLTVSQLIGEMPFDEDRKVRVVTLAMQQMPEYKKDMLVAASSALNQPETGGDEPKVANGH
jgi:transcriptional regulator with XRE-family HTH domain